jgi:hypothetical protein
MSRRFRARRATCPRHLDSPLVRLPRGYPDDSRIRVVWSAAEIATANRDLIQLTYDPGKVSVACGTVGRRLRPFGA